MKFSNVKLYMFAMGLACCYQSVAQVDNLATKKGKSVSTEILQPKPMLDQAESSILNQNGQYSANNTISNINKKFPQAQNQGSKAALQNTKDGGIHGGGGDSVISATGGKTLLDLEEQDELKFFNFELANYSKTIDNAYKLEILGCSSRDCDEDTFNPSASALGSNGKSIEINFFFRQLIAACGGSKSALSTTEFLGTFFFPVKPLRWAFTQSALEEIEDEGVIRVLNPDSKRQLAIQKDGLVVVNRNEFESMDQDGKAALKIHENVLCATVAANPALLKAQGTAPVRSFVRKFVNYASSFDRAEGVPRQAVQDAAALLFPDVERVDVGIQDSSEVFDKTGKVECSLHIRSGKQQNPNVLALCRFDQYAFNTKPNYDVIYSDPSPQLRFRLELIPEAKLFGKLDAREFRGYEKDAIALVQSLVKKNLKRLIEEWRKYLEY